MGHVIYRGTNQIQRDKSVTRGNVIYRGICQLQQEYTGAMSITGGHANYRGTHQSLFFLSNFGLSKVKIMLHENTVAISETCFAYNMVVLFTRED